MLHNGFQIDIRARLRFMQQHPTECAIGREGFLAQVTTWLQIAGVDPGDIERMFYPEKLSDMASTLSQPIVGDLHGSERVQASEQGVERVIDLLCRVDWWPVQVVDKALTLLPDPCIVIAVRRPHGES